MEITFRQVASRSARKKSFSEGMALVKCAGSLIHFTSIHSCIRISPDGKTATRQGKKQLVNSTSHSATYFFFLFSPSRGFVKTGKKKKRKWIRLISKQGWKMLNSARVGPILSTRCEIFFVPPSLLPSLPQKLANCKDTNQRTTAHPSWAELTKLYDRRSRITFCLFFSSSSIDRYILAVIREGCMCIVAQSV